MCMMGGGGGGGGGNRGLFQHTSPGWTSNTYYGYDPEREHDWRGHGNVLQSARRGVAAGLSDAAAQAMIENSSRGLRSRERMRGYNVGFGMQRGGPGPAGYGPTRDRYGNVLTPATIQPKTSTTTPAPAASTSPPPLPINPLEGLNINIPDPPPPPKAYQRQTSPASKKQRRAKTRKSSAEGKAGLTIERINY